MRVGVGGRGGREGNNIPSWASGFGIKKGGEGRKKGDGGRGREERGGKSIFSGLQIWNINGLNETISKYVFIG